MRGTPIKIWRFFPSEWFAREGRRPLPDLLAVKFDFPGFFPIAAPTCAGPFVCNAPANSSDIRIPGQNAGQGRRHPPANRRRAVHCTTAPARSSIDSLGAPGRRAWQTNPICRLGSYRMAKAPQSIPTHFWGWLPYESAAMINSALAHNDRCCETRGSPLAVPVALRKGAGATTGHWRPGKMSARVKRMRG
jgi:hypothetical protein